MAWARPGRRPQARRDPWRRGGAVAVDIPPRMRANRTAAALRDSPHDGGANAHDRCDGRAGTRHRVKTTSGSSSRRRATSPSASSSRRSFARHRRWRRWASSPAAWRMISTTCSLSSAAMPNWRTGVRPRTCPGGWTTSCAPRSVAWRSRGNCCRSRAATRQSRRSSTCAPKCRAWQKCCARRCAATLNCASTSQMTCGRSKPTLASWRSRC